jgi:hypothetical protein
MAAAFGRASVCAAVLGFSSLAALTSLAPATALAQVPAGYPADYQKVVDAAKKEGKVVIYSTTDAKVAAPIVKDFEAMYPGVKIEFNDMNSTELYNRYVSEQAAGAGSADVVWSSIVDSTFQLGKEYGWAYKSPEAGKLPASAVWKDTVWGMTYEPIAMVYNKRPRRCRSRTPRWPRWWRPSPSVSRTRSPPTTSRSRASASCWRCRTRGPTPSTSTP